MQNEGRKGADIEDRLLEFAVRVGKAIDALPNTRLGRHIAGQLVRSGTSPAPNYAEACAAESRKDFIHKLAIALKELRESTVWIRMIVKSDLIPQQRSNNFTTNANSSVESLPSHWSPPNPTRQAEITDVNILHVSISINQ